MPEHDNTKRKWMMPSVRAKGYADERKSKVHKHGKKIGEELTDYDKGLRSGYLLCQSDHAGAYKYTQALNAGMTKAQAAQISRTKGKKKTTKGGKTE